MIHLRRHGILPAGTVHANRKNVPSLFQNPPKMQCGEHKTFQDKNNRLLTATAWKDTGKFPVKFISTLSQPTVATHCVRRVGSSRQRISQPLVAHQYNRLYSFINMFELYRSKYRSSHLTRTPRDIEKSSSYKKFDLSKSIHCHTKLSCFLFLSYIVKQFSNLCLLCLPCYLLL